uniref:Uncharacterized protein n=1 Tax=Candidatus Kentrum sp. TC TaxID=2126339 RepID=A0A450Z9Y0_9GAMM|nr:MAG: hypothetical protein BECKTC1821E_GA0114239_108612 [Candidatus Kentron sp. TC]VFK50597.1 MAG: hypothetical protein BECKTC1821D_GA0114238_11122 [Candidatus Kentron sp. TC]
MQGNSRKNTSSRTIPTHADIGPDFVGSSAKPNADMAFPETAVSADEPSEEWDRLRESNAQYPEWRRWAGASIGNARSVGTV